MPHRQQTSRGKILSVYELIPVFSVAHQIDPAIFADEVEQNGQQSQPPGADYGWAPDDGIRQPRPVGDNPPFRFQLAASVNLDRVRRGAFVHGRFRAAAEDAIAAREDEFRNAKPHAGAQQIPGPVHIGIPQHKPVFLLVSQNRSDVEYSIDRLELAQALVETIEVSKIRTCKTNAGWRGGVGEAVDRQNSLTAAQEALNQDAPKKSVAAGHDITHEFADKPL